MASCRLSARLALSVAFPRRAAEDHARSGGLDRTPGEGESRLGLPQIHAELQKLGFTVAERTVARYLRRMVRRGDPDPRWLAFLRNHGEVIAALDFFTVPTVTFRSMASLS